jgi:S-adenosylmethionine-diacylglycerol 3-amino-3-carboxypropyl transferase
MNPTSAPARREAKSAEFRPEIGRVEYEILPSNVPWEKYTDRINYSSCNEDSASELAALQPGPGKMLVCITAGGGRVLDLLIDQPGEVWAVDVNIWQNYLLDLKIAAMKSLDYPDFLAFLGDRPSDHRWRTYGDVEHQLSPEARRFFNARPDIVRKGVLFQGHLERRLSVISKIIGLAWHKNREKLFEFQDLSKQRDFLTATWDAPLWRFMLWSICREKFLKVFIDDPGLLRLLPKNVPAYRSISERMRTYLWNNLARTNPLLSLIFFGRYVFESFKPLYLREESFHRIKKALHTTNIRIITGMIGDVLKEAPARSFDGYSLSDIASFMENAAFDRVMDEVFRTARPGARICARRCFTAWEFSDEHAKLVQRNPVLEKTLALRDHAMFTEFTVAEVR